LLTYIDTTTMAWFVYLQTLHWVRCLSDSMSTFGTQGNEWMDYSTTSHDTMKASKTLMSYTCRDYNPWLLNFTYSICVRMRWTWKDVTLLRSDGYRATQKMHHLDDSTRSIFIAYYRRWLQPTIASNIIRERMTLSSGNGRLDPLPSRYGRKTENRRTDQLYLQIHQIMTLTAL
jgi:hypothetical protein